jgi:RNA polymerase sigma-70 factor (ECF subfamily)
VCISAFLRTESPVARDVFLRRYYFFDSIEQIATRHGFSASKVKSMLHRTKGRLAAHLKKEGFEP